MLGGPEQVRAALAGVGADTLEAAHAVVQGMTQQVGGGLAPGQPLAVLPDPSIAVVKGRHGRVLAK